MKIPKTGRQHGVYKTFQPEEKGGEQDIGFQKQEWVIHR